MYAKVVQWFARAQGSIPGGGIQFFLTYRNIALRVSPQRDKVQTHVTSVLAFISCYLQIQSTFICRQWICSSSENISLRFSA